MAIKALEQELITDVSSVSHKIAEFFSNWDGDENAKMEISVNDMREIAFIYGKKARIERQLKEIRQESCNCEDAISRDNAINKVTNFYTNCERLKMFQHTSNEVKQTVVDILSDLPSVQPKPIECENAINRQDAINIVEFECGEWKGLAKEIVKQFNGLPPVQPKYNTDEWCHDCSEYNQDKHCCPRFNRVIRNAVEEIKEAKTGHWKVVSDGYGDNAYICECSECEDTVWVYKDANRKWNYCPNCGARMIEPQDKGKLSWLGKNCKDCGNEKCKKLGTLPKGHDCALWQPERK